MSDGNSKEEVGAEFTTAADCTPLTADDHRLGRVSGSSTRDDSARFSNSNVPSPLGRHSSRDAAQVDNEGEYARSANEGDSMDAPTLMAGQAREVAAAFERARQEQAKGRQLTNQTSLQPHTILGEVRDWQQYYRKDWTPDRGSDTNEQERRKEGRPSLVETGRAAGRSRVHYTSTRVLAWHMWHRDFFLTTIHQNVWKLLGCFSLLYLASFFFFSLLWYTIWRCNEDCLYGIRGYPMVFNFSVVTQQTIGYGNSGPNNCAWASLVLVAQTIFGLLLDAITIGVLFARISHPQQRARSIFMSETAVIARRDGILKLMFRIADIKTTQVVEPMVRAYLYTWGDGRHTVEGEFIPCRNEELDLGNIDGLLLLPITIEHTIDERSPLCGHTHDSLQALNAEVVVTFEGTTEMGNPFMSRQSYLANEIRWGYQFVRCIHRPRDGGTHYMVDTAKFHQIEPQPDLPMMPQSQLAQLVVSRSKRAVPYPILGENTLVLSESMVLTEDNGELALMFRVGDTYPNQILDPIVRAYVYRWPDDPKGVKKDYTIQELDVGYDTGADRLLLWLPMVVKHTITPVSPLASWKNMSGFLADADSCIAVVVEGYMYCNSQNRMRMRIYNCFNDIKLHHHFAHIVSRPLDSPDRKPRIEWSRFHCTTADPDNASSLLGRMGSTPKSPPRTGSKSARRTWKKQMSMPNGSSASEADAESQTEAEWQMRDEASQQEEAPLKEDAEPAQPPQPSLLQQAEDMTMSTFEGASLSSLLPHLDSTSSFNRQAGQSLHRRRLPPEAYYEGSASDFRRSNTLPSRRRTTDTLRAALPVEWRRSITSGQGQGEGLPGNTPSMVAEEDSVV